MKATAPRCRCAGSAFAAPGQTATRLSCTTRKKMQRRVECALVALQVVAQMLGNLPEEWWHYTLQPEPYPDRYFNFSVR